MLEYHLIQGVNNLLLNIQRAFFVALQHKDPDWSGSYAQKFALYKSGIYPAGVIKVLLWGISHTLPKQLSSISVSKHR